jgi:hypothetical protein
MSIVYDTLEYDGNEKSFAAWGFGFDAMDELGNQKADVFTATIVETNIATEAAAPTFPFEAAVIVRTNRSSSNGSANSFSGGTIMFSGKRVGNPARATGTYEGVTYKFQGPWYDLGNTPFQQLFYGSGTSTYLLPEMILNTSTAVTSGQILISVGDQIQAILQWLLDQYSAQGLTAPFQYVGRALDDGAINLDSTDGVYDYLVDASTTTIEYSLFGLFLPSYIAKPMTCADAIIKCLQLSPRVTISFDYTTSPPTFYAVLVDNMTPATLPLFDGVSHTRVNILSRDDLLVRAVNLIYRITNHINHSPVVDYAQDKWGPNGSNSPLDPETGLRVINELVDLQGINNTTTTAHLDVEPVLATADSGGTTQALKRTWWQEPRGGNVSKLVDSRVRFQTGGPPGAIIETLIPDATITDAATGSVLTTADLIAYGLCDASGNLVLNRVVRGSVHAWMVRSDGQPVVCKKVHIAAAMQYVEYDAQSSSTAPDTDTAGIALTKGNTVQHHVDMEVTNGVTQAYTTLASTTPGEAYIIGNGGTAQYLYNHLNQLQYEGDYTKVEVTFGSGVTLRNAINFSNGAAAWATMNAQPQSIRRHYGMRTTEVQIGVAKHLNSGQLSAILNMWRYRRTWYNPLMRTQNTLDNSGNVDQAITTANANSPSGLTNPLQTSVYAYSSPPSGATPGVISGGIISPPGLLPVHDGFNSA